MSNEQDGLCLFGLSQEGRVERRGLERKPLKTMIGASCCNSNAAHTPGLNGWELDRRLYHATGGILKAINGAKRIQKVRS
jgi:hypothetical protein